MLLVPLVLATVRIMLILILSKPHPERASATAVSTNPVTLHLYDLSDEFDVVYESPAGDQTVSMEFDDPDSGVSLDRANYPQNTGVVITIDDQALNVDPTSEDTWTFTTGGGDQFYGTVDEVTALAQAVTDRDDDIADR